MHFSSPTIAISNRKCERSERSSKNAKKGHPEVLKYFLGVGVFGVMKSPDLSGETDWDGSRSCGPTRPWTTTVPGHLCGQKVG